MAINTGELSNFFEQILHTERSLSSRSTKLRRLKGEVQSCLQVVQEVRREVEMQQGELAVRSVTMVDEEVEAKLLGLREAILDQQKDQLLATNQNMATELEAVNSKLESEREQFFDELREFGQSYDLVGAGYKHREQLTQKKVSTLQDEILLLEAELVEFEYEREEVRRLEQELVEVEEMVAKKQEGKKALEDEVVEGGIEIGQLQDECESFGSKLSSDPEILRLQRELEECKDCSEEKRYHSLQQELEELQRLCYHRQMKQHMSRTKGRPEGMMSNSNHYIYNYGSVRSVSSVSGVNGDGVEVESVREGGEGEGGHGEAGEEEEEEGWDDELEAAELALFQESMSVSEMDWIGEEEKEREEEEEEDRMDPTPLASRDTTGANTAQRRVPNRPPPTPRAVRTVMKAPGGDGSGRRLVAHLAQVTDSPATVPVRKHSGQSIYKAPGQQQEPPSQKGVPKTAKKVRFRY